VTYPRGKSLPQLERQALVSMIARLAAGDDAARFIAAIGDRIPPDLPTLQLTMSPARRRPTLSATMTDRPSPETEVLR
jgi:hypothetical protein